MKRIVFFLLAILFFCAAPARADYWKDDLFKIDASGNVVEVKGYGLDNIADVIATAETVTVAASGGDFTTIGDAITYANAAFFEGPEAALTISVSEGVWAQTGELKLDSPYANRITITGAGFYPTDSTYYTTTSVQSITGSAGSWTVVMNMNGTAWQSTVEVGDFIYCMQAPTGGTGGKNLAGIFEVTNVNTTDNRISFINTHALTLSSLVSGNVVMKFQKFKTVVTRASTAVTEFVFNFPVRVPKKVEKLGVVCTGTKGRGLNFSGTGNVNVEYVGVSGFAQTYESCGMYVGRGTLATLTAVAVSNCYDGVFGFGVCSNVGYVWVTGNRNFGIYSSNQSFTFHGFACGVVGNPNGVALGRSGTLVVTLGGEVSYNTTGIENYHAFSRVVIESGTLTGNTRDFRVASFRPTYRGNIVVYDGATNKMTAKTSAFDLGSLGAYAEGECWTNTGASALVPFTLDEALPGKVAEFYVDDFHGISIAPDTASERIWGLTDADGDAIQSTTPGDWIKLECIKAGTWNATYQGTWSDID